MSDKNSKTPEAIARIKKYREYCSGATNKSAAPENNMEDGPYSRVIYSENTDRYDKDFGDEDWD